MDEKKKVTSLSASFKLFDWKVKRMIVEQYRSPIISVER